MSIIVDKEFESLIPPLSADEFKQLEENCCRDGIRDPLVLWKQPDGNDVLIDGHNRWKIAAKHCGIEFERRYEEFESREDAKRWIILNQFGRRNLSAYDRSVLALKLKPLIAEKAKEKQASHTEQGYQKSEKAVHTAKEIAKTAGVSHDTIHKVEKIEAEASDRTKQLVREGKLSINQAFNSVHPKRPDPVKKAKEEHDRFVAEGNKIVDIKAARVDQINQKIIDNALTQDVLKLLGTIEKFGFEHKTEELKALQTELSEDAKTNMQGLIKNCHMVLDQISSAISRR